MNHIKRKALSILMMQAVGSADTGGSNNAPPPELLDAMPESTRNPDGPVGRSWMDAGKEAADRIIKAEMGVDLAEKTVKTTKRDALKELTELATDQERQTFIAGANLKFLEVKNPIHKKHQNFLADLRRVAKAVEIEGPAKVRLLIDAEGKDYRQMMESIPVRSTQGGGNKGGGAASIVDQAKELAKLDPKALQAAIEAAKTHPSSPETSKTVEGKEGTPATAEGQQEGAPAPRQQQQTTVSEREITSAIAVCHFNAIRGIAEALAKRCALSPAEEDQELGKAIAQFYSERDARPTMTPEPQPAEAQG